MAPHRELIDRARSASATGDFAGAERTYLAAITADPLSAETWQALGVARARLGRHQTAEEAYREALRLRPDYAEAHNNLGQSLEALGRPAEALSCYQECLRIRPDLAQAHVNLGGLLIKSRRFAEAEGHTERALNLAPHSADAHFLHGTVLMALERHGDAEVALRQAATLNANSWDIHQKLGDTSWILGHWQAARASYERALVLQPGNALTMGNLGLVLSDLGLLDESLAMFGRSLAIDRNNHEFHRNRALVWLLQGDFARGWPEYEWRFGCVGLPIRPFPRPLWDGSPLGGRTILVHCEQGLGDTLQFLRYVPMVKARGGRVVLVCQPALKRLLTGLPYVDELIVQGDAIPAFDVHCPLLSLPRIFGTTPDNIPAEVPYLQPDPALTEHWQSRLAAVEGFKIGVAWQGSPKFRKDRERSFPLRRLAPLAELSSVRLVSIQKGPGREQIADEAASAPLLDLGGELDESTGPFLDTAALMKSLDLVITPDTVVAHLAGALGVPVWVALGHVPHWPWLLDRTDSPWYPSARLFRQPQRGDWDAVFRAMTEALSNMICGHMQIRGAENG
jgi:tetratricopeptide (TPR) repeat protein/ADP-heptose:LPS heptosyltransferase